MSRTGDRRHSRTPVQPQQVQRTPPRRNSHVTASASSETAQGESTEQARHRRALQAEKRRAARLRARDFHQGKNVKSPEQYLSPSSLLAKSSPSVKASSSVRASVYGSAASKKPGPVFSSTGHARTPRPGYSTSDEEEEEEDQEHYKDARRDSTGSNAVYYEAMQEEESNLELPLDLASLSFSSPAAVAVQENQAKLERIKEEWARMSDTLRKRACQMELQLASLEDNHGNHNGSPYASMHRRINGTTTREQLEFFSRERKTLWKDLMTLTQQVHAIGE